MVWNNRVAVVGDITGDIYYDVIQIEHKPVPFLRVYMVINATHESQQIKGLRIVFYGADAELAEAYLKMGSRILVQGHLQMRKDKRNIVVVEVVSEHICYIRNFDLERGNKRLNELCAAGRLAGSDQRMEFPENLEVVA